MRHFASLKWTDRDWETTKSAAFVSIPNNLALETHRSNGSRSMREPFSFICKCACATTQ